MKTQKDIENVLNEFAKSHGYKRLGTEKEFKDNPEAFGEVGSANEGYIGDWEGYCKENNSIFNFEVVKLIKKALLQQSKEFIDLSILLN